MPTEVRAGNIGIIKHLGSFAWSLPRHQPFTQKYLLLSTASRIQSAVVALVHSQQGSRIVVWLVWQICAVGSLL